MVLFQHHLKVSCFIYVQWGSNLTLVFLVSLVSLQQKYHLIRIPRISLVLFLFKKKRTPFIYIKFIIMSKNYLNSYLYIDLIRCNKDTFERKKMPYFRIRKKVANSDSLFNILELFFSMSQITVKINCQ
jgi:hypothetical protein